MFLRFFLILVILLLFPLNLLINKKQVEVSKYFQEMWIGIKGPVYGETYYECLNAKGIDSKHFILFGFKAVTENVTVQIKLEVVNLSTGKTYMSIPTADIALKKDERPFYANIPVELPFYSEHGFYYAKLYINGEFVNYKKYDKCAGNMVAYK